MNIIKALALVAMLNLPALATERVGDLVFQTSFDSVAQEARTLNKPILIKFYTDW